MNKERHRRKARKRKTGTRRAEQHFWRKRWAAERMKTTRGSHRYREVRAEEHRQRTAKKPTRPPASQMEVANPHAKDEKSCVISSEEGIAGQHCRRISRHKCKSTRPTQTTAQACHGVSQSRRGQQMHKSEDNKNHNAKNTGQLLAHR